MNKNQKTKEKTCAFYASDYHFEMISLPFINQNLDEKKEIIVLTENNLEKTMETLISKMNWNEERKNKIFKMNWKNDDINKLEKIKKEIENKQEIIVFVKGREKYIKNMNQNIENYLNKSNNVKIIDCYNIEEVGENLDIVMDKYQKVLGTSGEREIEKI